jgi:hypothetical protein
MFMLDSLCFRAMNAAWYRDLYQIGSFRGATAVVLRVAAAVGVPLIGGVLVGHPHAGVAGGATGLFVTLSDIGETPTVRLSTMLAGFVAIVLGGILGHFIGDTPYGRETVVLACALLAGWASGSHPGIAAVTRFFAVAAAAATGMHFTDSDVMLAVALGGCCAFAAAFLAWRWFRIPTDENLMDWRAGVRRACHGSDAGLRFTLCYGAAAATALFAANGLGVKDAFWATLVVLMVMRREGVASLELTIHYAVGTVIGVLLGEVVLSAAHGALFLALFATLAASFARVAFAVNPALGFLSFTMFLLFSTEMIAALGGPVPEHLLETRLFDVSVGCAIALAGTLAAIYPRLSRSMRR